MMPMSVLYTRRSFWFVLWTSLALLLTWSCLHFASETQRYNREWDEAFIAEPANFPIDLAKVGMTEGIFHHTFYRGHGLSFYFVTTDKSETTRDRIEGIRGSLSILNEKREPIESVDPLTQTSGWELPDKMNGRRIAYLFTGLGAKGDYLVQVNISSHSQSLRDQSVRVIARYHLCGCEKMISVVTCGFSIVSGLAAFIFALAAWSCRRPKTRKSQFTSANGSPLPIGQMPS